LDEGTSDMYVLESNYKNLTDVISDYIEADCFAVRLNNNILFNTNVENMAPRDYIMEQMIRDKLIESPHSYLLCNMLRKNMDFTLEIFMFRFAPWKLVVKYDSNLKRFHVYKLVSQQYLDRYGEN
jgi:GTP-sensing pleiotropic transcriptional regulator CodY